MGLLDGRMAFQKMLTIDHIHSTIQHMEHEIRKQKARATMLFDDVLHAKKSRWLRMHFKRNHNSRTRQDSPDPLPVLPPFQSPSPPPPPVPVPGTPENPIDVDEGTAESPIEILDGPELFAGEESDKEFPFQGWTDPSVVNDWKGQVNWNTARQCENCGSISHGTRWCREGLTFNSETGFWYMDKLGSIWASRGAVLWIPPIPPALRSYLFLFHASHLTHSFHCFIFIVSLWLELRLEGCARQHATRLSLFTHSL